jgi:hypothetical protein
MGRGRAKAKQTKVARELKYHSPDINLERLRADISGESGGSGQDVDDTDDEFGYDDEDEDEDETGSSGRAWSR